MLIWCLGMFWHAGTRHLIWSTSPLITSQQSMQSLAIAKELHDTLKVCAWISHLLSSFLLIFSLDIQAWYPFLFTRYLSEDTTVHLPLLPPPPIVPDTSLHTNDRSPTYKSDLCVRPTSPTYVSDLRVWPTCLTYVSGLRVQLSDHIIISIIYLR